MTFDIVIPTTGQAPRECVESVKATATLAKLPLFISGIYGMVIALQAGYQATPAEVIAFLHDDVVIHEPRWDERVLAEFADPDVGVVGFGGGTAHGTDDIYKRPYDYRQLARAGYRSNTDDAEAHGERFDGACDVAVLDGFALVVRRALLDKVGGWPVEHITFHSYDYWLTLTARRLGYRVRMVGVRCQHLGGQTSTKQPYQEWLAAHGLTDERTHQESHRYIYEEFRDVLPVRLP